MTFQEKIAYFKEKQEKIAKLHQELENEKALYRAEIKAWSGITDGEPANVLEIIETIKKVQAME